MNMKSSNLIPDLQKVIGEMYVHSQVFYSAYPHYQSLLTHADGTADLMNYYFLLCLSN